MSRFLSCVFLICAFAATGLAQQAHSGYVEVAFGQVRGVDGKMHSIQGMRLPFYAEPIEARPISELQRDPPQVLPSGGDNTTVYNADSNSGYGVIEDPDPSSLDDIVMSGGAGLPWKHLTFGIEIGAQRSVLIRWIAFSSFVQGRGPGVSAFDNVVADFGVVYPSATPGTYKVTIDVAAAGVVVPSNSIYMAQQFRVPNLTGTGAFDLAFKTVYNSAGPVTTGSSDNVFWYDADRNGIYDESEIDFFGETLFANHLRTITVAGTQDTLVPFSLLIESGLHVSGDITDLFYKDNNYYKLMTSPPLAPMRLVVEGISPSASILSLKFSVKAKTSGPGAGSMKVELFNYVTNSYDEVATTALGLTDTELDVVITNNPSKYVHPSTRRLLSRLTASQSLRTSRTWFFDVDQTIWVITR